jgi:uncharacterized membrane protein YccF (DUF307 family)
MACTDANLWLHWTGDFLTIAHLLASVTSAVALVGVN